MARAKRYTLLAGLVGSLLGILMFALTMAGALERFSYSLRALIAFFLAVSVNALLHPYYALVGGRPGVKTYLETLIASLVMEYSVWIVAYNMFLQPPVDGELQD
ncbi:MAG: hypothetical protein F7C07_00905 [Desulfurococcales archaeon]|nr:hypothetical protein [Desulfurococcales archaeon]